MQWIVPFAAPASDAGRHALQTLKLPRLDALLREYLPARRDEGDERSLSPPHERALARALGLSGADGELPWAAWQAEQDGIDTGDLAWGLLTPVHWDVGVDQVRLADPAALQLDEPESRAFFDAVHPLFESEGLLLSWGAPTRWYIAHESLHSLATASLDRVVGQGIETWLPRDPAARLLRRLQNETQMLLYTHALNEAREAEGRLPVNSFWLSGCGLRQPVHGEAQVRFDDRLRAPALAEDWAAWADAWIALDNDLRSADFDTLVLCGSRHGVELQRRSRTLWQRLQARWRAPSTMNLLESL